MKDDDGNTQSEPPPRGPGDTREDPSDPRDGERASGSSENHDERAHDGRSRPDDVGRASSLRDRLARAAGGRVRLGRYEVVRLIGEGGMGEVYEAIHVERGERVALKTLLRMSGRNLYRFKNEFRSLVGVSHPNLVALHELCHEDGIWFFTMDLVDGTSFDVFVQATVDTRFRQNYLGRTFSLEERPWTEPRVSEAEPAPRAPPTLPLRDRRRAAFHEQRLRDALRELSIGVAALHARGLQHRDLNPTNVLVTAEGRVVVLDFGLICGERERVAALDGCSGTPSYMAPEQGTGKPGSTACDWYAVGVMLFEALTGRLPFHGNWIRVMTEKRRTDAPRPSTIVSGVPRDLDDLCVALLQRNPADRPDGRDVLDRLDARRAPAAAAERPAWVARKAELGAIDQAYRAAQAGEDACVLVYGAAGTGKTALCERFLDTVAGPRPLVLRGAASAVERVPHQAIDPIVDALALHLQSIDAEAAQNLVPPEARDLAQVFPVLEGIAAIEALPAKADRDAGAWAPVLAEIVRRLAASRPLVVWLDDVENAAGGLAGVIDAVLGAALDAGRRPLLILSGACEADAAGARARRVRVEALSHADTCALVQSATGADARRAADIARDVGGSPALVARLLGFAAATGRGDASVAAMIEAQLDQLAAPALRLAEVLAAAHQPLPQAVAFGAAGLAGTATASVRRLGAARLARAQGPGEGDAIAIDARARDVIARRIPAPSLQRIHGEIASRLERWPGADPTFVAQHLAGAGRFDDAATRVAQAAARASADRDHGRAAELWARASNLAADGSPALLRSVEAKRAEALGESGRAVEAARAFLSAALEAPPDQAMDLRRRASELLIVSGRVDEGRPIQRRVLKTHGIDFPPTPGAALFRIAAGLLKLRLRGTAIPDWAERAAPPAARARIEALWSAGRSLSWIDPIRSSAFMVEATYAALTEGDVALSARGVAFIGCLHVYGGSPADERRGNAMIDQASLLARRAGDPYLAGFVRCCSGLSRMCAGLWREAAARVDEGFSALSARGGTLVWERHAHRIITNQTLFALGSLSERARAVKRALEESRATGDRFGTIEAELATAFARICAGESSAARRDAAATISRFYGDAFTLQHNIALWLETSSLLYEGAQPEAWKRLEAAAPALRASQLLRIQLVRIEADLLRGVTAASLAGVDRARADDLLRIAEDSAVSLGRERRTHARAAASMVRAGMAAARGGLTNESIAVTHLREAAADYDSAEMKIHAACARRAMGPLLGGTHGAQLAARADNVLRSEGVAEPARFTRMYTGIPVDGRR